MDTNPDHFSSLALRVRGNNLPAHLMYLYIWDNRLNHLKLQIYDKLKILDPGLSQIMNDLIVGPKNLKNVSI